MRVKMEYLVVVTLENLDLHNKFPDGVALFDNMKISKDPATLKKLLDRHGDIKKQIGSLYYGDLEKKPFVFMHGQVNVGTEEDEIGNELQSALSAVLRKLQLFCSLLWLSKDCCVSTGDGYVFVGSSYVSKYNIYTHTNRYTKEFYNSLGERKVEQIRIRERREVCRNMNELFENTEISDCSDARQLLIDFSNSDKLSRALYLTDKARSYSLPNDRIAEFIVVLESLFCCQASEIAHRLSERVACFLGDSRNKLATYKTIKEAYNYRSKVVHGSTKIKEEKYDDLTKISGEIEGIVKAVLTSLKVDEPLLTFKDEGEINDHFMEIILG